MVVTVVVNKDGDNYDDGCNHNYDGDRIHDEVITIMMVGNDNGGCKKGIHATSLIMQAS